MWQIAVLERKERTTMEYGVTHTHTHTQVLKMNFRLRPRLPLPSRSGTMDDMLSGCTYTLPSYTFEDGTTLKKVDVRYNTFGEMNATKDNIVVVCHALTGNAAVDTWWTGMVGAGCSIDTDKYMVVCANVLGSCYGSCGPMSVNPETGQQYGRDFPAVTIRDTVAVHSLMLKDGLGVHAVACVVGGSMGGMQALEWTFVATVPVRAAVVLSTGGRHTPWQIGMSELQRQAIYADPKFKEGAYDPADPPNSGLAVARQIAMVSYRTHNSYFTKFGRREQETPSIIESTRGGSNSAVQSYLKYQGEKFIERGFDANTYLALTNQMDTHDVSRGRGTYLKVLNSITIPTLIVGITSDVLYPIVEQQELAEHLGNATLKLVDSEEGQWTPPLHFFFSFFLG